MQAIEGYELQDGIANDAPHSPGFRAGCKVSQAINAILRSAEEVRWLAIDAEAP